MVATFYHIVGFAKSYDFCQKVRVLPRGIIFLKTTMQNPLLIFTPPCFCGNLSISLFVKTQLHFSHIIPQTPVESRFPGEKHGGFNMSRSRKHIHRPHPLRRIPQLLHIPHIPNQRLWITGHINHLPCAKLSN